MRKAKILAAKQDKSLNALVRDALERAVEGDRGYRSAGERLLRLSTSGLYDIPPNRWTRDELYE